METDVETVYPPNWTSNHLEITDYSNFGKTRTIQIGMQDFADASFGGKGAASKRGITYPSSFVNICSSAITLTCQQQSGARWAGAPDGSKNSDFKWLVSGHLLPGKCGQVGQTGAKASGQQGLRQQKSHGGRCLGVACGAEKSEPFKQGHQIIELPKSGGTSFPL